MNADLIKYECTFEVTRLLQAEAASRGLKLVINGGAHDDGEPDFDDSTDDDITFEGADDSLSLFHVQSGPYGVSLNEMNAPGEEWSMTHWVDAEPGKIGEFCARVWKKLDEEIAKLAVAPRVSAR